VGDGNHSLATAKQCYENLKKVTPREQWASLPARYALVEVVNNHDDALKFEPIHRVLFGVEAGEVLDALKAAYPGAYEGRGEGHTIAYTCDGRRGFITVPSPRCSWPWARCRPFLDRISRSTAARWTISTATRWRTSWAPSPATWASVLPAMGKEQLFKTVMADGVLPRKTFSMGHAQDKRYYVEARKIR
jgi:hypothetical protein